MFLAINFYQFLFLMVGVYYINASFEIISIIIIVSKICRANFLNKFFFKILFKILFLISLLFRNFKIYGYQILKRILLKTFHLM